MNVIALDVSMGQSYYVAYEEEVCISEGVLKHTKNDLVGLLSLYNSFATKPDFIFESTGIYSKVIERFCNEFEIEYFLMNPLEAKLQTEHMRSQKSDMKDAHRLAQSHFRFNRKVKKQADNIYLELKSLSRMYDNNEQDIKRVRSRLHEHLQLSFPEMEGTFSNVSSQSSLVFIKHYPHPDILLRESRTIIKNKVVDSTNKNISKAVAITRADKLLKIAENSYPAVPKEDIIVRSIPRVCDDYIRLLERKEELKKELIKLAGSLNEYETLMSFPQIGELTAALLIAEIGNIHNFKTRQQLSAYSGLAPRSYQSGKYEAKDRMNKRGNAHARRILFLIVTNMIRGQALKPNHIVDYYYKQKSPPYSKKNKVAIVACMNRLLRSIHYLVTHNLKYDYDLAPKA